MTFTQLSRNYLFISGISKADAEKIIELAKQDKILSAMAGHWDDNIEEYSTDMQSVFIVSLESVAEKYKGS